MAGNHSYSRLPSIHESQDIADINHDPFDSQWSIAPPNDPPPPPGYSSIELCDVNTDGQSLRSFDTGVSSSSVSSIDKLKNGWNRIRRKPVPRYMRGSVRRHAAADIQPTRIGRGVWKDQLLVDRSLRSMAALMTLFAIAMIIVVASHMKDFYARVNKFTSSVGGGTRDCKDVTHTNTALLLLINVAATMTLGMSNTYQQLVTSLRIPDLKHMLQKHGDSRVGTNSPFSILHKSQGKKTSWAFWILLICTSLPVHFLANSLIGPSYVLEPPRSVQFNESSWESVDDFEWDSGENYILSSGSFVCWSAFKTGQAHYPQGLGVLLSDETSMMGSFGRNYARIVVQYARENCTGLANSTNDLGMLEASHDASYGYISFSEGECRMGTSVFCSLFDSEPSQCRLNVRMNAAFVLAGCLIAKAIYMVGVNLLTRGKLKRHLLTFGDVLVASASDPELRVQGECLVNGGDSVRRRTNHTCHKHCKNKEESKTGDETGQFSQDYLLQLPKKILFPIMAYSVLTHWMLGEALQTQEAIWLENDGVRYVEHSKHIITYAAYPLWIATFLILLMTAICWWAFTYRRDGFIPQMYGSIRTLCASTTQLDDFPNTGIMWGDLGVGRQFRHAGLSAEEVMKIVPNELYAGLMISEDGT